MDDRSPTSYPDSLEEWQRLLDQDDYGDQLLNEAMDQFEDGRNLWHFMALWEAAQQPPPMEINLPQQDDGMDIDVLSPPPPPRDEEPLQYGGGLDRPLFHFRLAPFVHRVSPEMGVDERVFRVHLEQRRDVVDPARYHLFDKLASGLRQAFDQLLERQDIQDGDRLYFSLGSNRLDHAYNGWGLTAGEWRNNTERVVRVFDNLTMLLKSNEEFRVDDSFTLALVHVQGQPQGGGKKRKKFVPGKMSGSCLRIDKKTVLTIPQDDEPTDTRVRVLVAVATTDMKNNSECVMAWCENEERLLRPVTNQFTNSWALGTFTVGNKYKFKIGDEPLLQNGLYPHKNEDILVKEQPDETTTTALNQQELYDMLVGSAKNSVSDIFGSNNIKEDKYIEEGTYCVSAGILHSTTDHILFEFNEYEKLRCKVQVLYTNQTQTFDFPVAAQKLPDVKKDGVHDCLVLLGLARPWAGKDGEYHPCRCYIMVIGVILGGVFWISN